MKKNRALLMAAILVMISLAGAAGGLRAAHEDRAALSADQALELLKAGNERFSAGARTFPHQDSLRIEEVCEQGQQPYVTVLTCSDSRVPPEILFDAGIGDIFVMRVAGEVCATDQMATLEYALEHLGTSLFVVLGHTKCGAVTAAADDAVLEGSLPALAEKIRPAVRRVRERCPDLAGQTFYDQCSTENVWVVIEDFLAGSTISRERIKTGAVRVEGAMYDLATGKVTFLGPHPRQEELLGER